MMSGRKNTPTCGQWARALEPLPSGYVKTKFQELLEWQERHHKVVVNARWYLEKIIKDSEYYKHRNLIDVLRELVRDVIKQLPKTEKYR